MAHEEMSAGEREKGRKYTFTISLVGDPIGRTPEFVKEKSWEFTVNKEQEYATIVIWNEIQRKIQEQLEQIGVDPGRM